MPSRDKEEKVKNSNIHSKVILLGFDALQCSPSTPSCPLLSARRNGDSTVRGFSHGPRGTCLLVVQAADPAGHAPPASA